MTKVLVAEDNTTLLENITLELELLGYEVLQATNGQGALNVLKTTDQLPDIIVSDIAMPDLDGFQLLEHVRSDPAWEGIPFLFLTAFDNQDNIRVSKQLGADDYIVKPFMADDLVLAMQSKIKRIAAFQKKAEAKLDESRTELLNLIAHELRTPLTAVYGGSEVLEDMLEEIPDETVHSMVHLIKKGADRLKRFTSQTTALMRIDAGELQKALKYAREHDVNEIVQAAVGTINLMIRAEEMSVSIEVDMPETVLEVFGNFEFLVMMVEEPLRNAVMFSPTNGTVQLSVQQDGDNVVITIIDNGGGMVEANIERVWGRFIQAERDEHEQQGTGLGLAITRESARIHEGDCTLVSTPGQGTCFTLTLPLAFEMAQ